MRNAGKSLFSEYSLCVDQIQLLRRIVAQLSYRQRSILRSEVKQSIMWDTKVGVWGSKFMLTSSHLLQCVLRQYDNNEMQVNANSLCASIMIKCFRLACCDGKCF